MWSWDSETIGRSHHASISGKRNRRDKVPEVGKSSTGQRQGKESRACRGGGAEERVWDQGTEVSQSWNIKGFLHQELGAEMCSTCGWKLLEGFLSGGRQRCCDMV